MTMSESYLFPDFACNIGTVRLEMVSVDWLSLVMSLGVSAVGDISSGNEVMCVPSSSCCNTITVGAGTGNSDSVFFR